MGYFIRFFEKDKEGNIAEGILKVPDDISDEEAQKKIKEGTAVLWYVPPDVEKKYDELKKEKEEEEEE